VGDEAVPSQRMAILRNGDESDGVVLQADAPARALLIAGRPLNESIVQYGPFVMNTKEEIIQAVQDFQAGKFTQT
jgi:redox-sensitive bicupin YhaK (pirin superfamily)